MDRRLRFETTRKGMHLILTVWPILFAYLFIERWTAVGIYVAYLVFWLVSEYLRTRFGMNTPTAYMLKKVSRHSVGRNLDRSRSKIRFPYWIAAGVVVLALFNYTVVIASTVCLAFGDTVAGLLKSSMPRKHEAAYLGTFVGFLVSAAIIFALTSLMYVALVAAAVGMLGDLLPKKLNDNATIPLLAAVGAYAVLAL